MKSSTRLHDYANRSDRATTSGVSLAQKKSPREKPREQRENKQTHRGQPAPNHAENRARETDTRPHNNGNTPNRQPRESTDGKGNANEAGTNKPRQPARRNHDRATAQRAPAGDAANRKEPAEPEPDAQPGTRQARPEQHTDKGHQSPAQERGGSPGKRNHTAKQQRHENKRADTTNTPKEKTEQNTEPADPRKDRTGTSTVPHESKGRRSPRISSASSHTNSSFRRMSGCDGELCITLASCVTMVDPCVHYYLHVVEQAHGCAGVSGSTETTAKRMDACSVAARPPCRRRGVISASPPIYSFLSFMSVLLISRRKEDFFCHTKKDDTIGTAFLRTFATLAITASCSPRFSSVSCLLLSLCSSLVYSP